MKTIIRKETPADYREVENIVRDSFWNVYQPGADEHYFAHMMRTHPDFIPEGANQSRTVKAASSLSW